MTKETIAEEIGGTLEEVAALAKFGLREAELEALFITADELGPKVLVEIGACHGLSSIILAAVARKYSGMLYSVEPGLYVDWLPNLERYGLGKFATLIKARSPWLDWPNIPFKTIDYLLIDGDHHYFPAAADISAFAPKVRKGGRLAFHDYSHPRPNCVRPVVDKYEEFYGTKRVALVTGKCPGLLVLEKV